MVDGERNLSASVSHLQIGTLGFVEVKGHREGHTVSEWLMGHQGSGLLPFNLEQHPRAHLPQTRQPVCYGAFVMGTALGTFLGTFMLIISCSLPARRPSKGR